MKNPITEEMVKFILKDSQTANHSLIIDLILTIVVAAAKNRGYTQAGDSPILWDYDKWFWVDYLNH